MLLCALGDLLLDVIVRLEEPLEAGTDAGAITRAGAGGQAANVAAWATELGADARFVARRATDAAGELAARELAARGVEVLGPVVDGRNGIVVSLVDAHGERTMATDRGVAPSLAPDDLDAAWFGDCSHLHLSGYSVMVTPIYDAARTAARMARSAGATVSVDLASVSGIRATGAERLRARLAELAPDTIFGTEAERDAVGAIAAPTWVVKRGARGCAVERAGERVEYAAHPADVVDTTGAGDALAAGFLVGGPELGLTAAARCVAKLGTMP